ncbi:ubiquitin-like-conjugating enzyme ATG10 isoform X2 [Amphiura filiformis]|uniref:ubiquitin-like-conjugating enzyme ATG10 isoform X2 n=1 Tax=Amphiura filiformis TaxID=82378 RepID=UPI003B223CFA
MATGCASFDEFCRNVDAFLKLSDQSKDGWQRSTFEDSSHQLTPYMVKKNVLRHSVTSQREVIPDTNTVLSTEDSTEDQLVEDDTGTAAAEKTLTESSSEFHQYEYHIVYSSSYSVPVLYFTACKSDGKLLSLDEVWQAIPEYYQTRLQHQRWTFITQQEHPYLGRPFFQLHPCHTADLMHAVLPQGTDSTKRSNYLVTWLSSVGPVVGLSLPLFYSQLCNRDR